MITYCITTSERPRILDGTQTCILIPATDSPPAIGQRIQVHTSQPHPIHSQLPPITTPVATATVAGCPALYISVDARVYTHGYRFDTYSANRLARDLGYDTAFHLRTS